MDELSLDRAIQLLEYARREEAAANQGSEARDNAPPSPDWKAPTEAMAEEQFAMASALMPGPAGSTAPVLSKIPEDLREAIRWAEAEKAKRGLS